MLVQACFGIGHADLLLDPISRSELASAMTGVTAKSPVSRGSMTRKRIRHQAGTCLLGVAFHKKEECICSGFCRHSVNCTVVKEESELGTVRHRPRSWPEFLSPTLMIFEAPRAAVCGHFHQADAFAWLIRDSIRASYRDTRLNPFHRYSPVLVVDVTA